MQKSFATLISDEEIRPESLRRQVVQLQYTEFTGCGQFSGQNHGELIDNWGSLHVQSEFPSFLSHIDLNCGRIPHNRLPNINLRVPIPARIKKMDISSRFWSPIFFKTFKDELFCWFPGFHDIRAVPLARWCRVSSPYSRR
jgi:hypothetical protein